ncbi:unnamed protein product [Adineta ricciae]|uniref:Uncharacterized protein n=1 Tax=Adineta ricciae TaxID=249248 RepID=A0A816DP17_ADIRI|nr:unnamed protein product [Adineta ricciae]
MAETQDLKIQSLQTSTRSLSTLTKSLSKKYSNLFENLTGLPVSHDTKYYDICKYLPEFLNDLHTGQSSSLITSKEEKQYLEKSLGFISSYYRIISEQFVHEAPKVSLAESTLRSHGSKNEMWINMYRFVYDEEPHLDEIFTDMPLMSDDINITSESTIEN